MKSRLASLLAIFFFLGCCNAGRHDCHSSCGTLQNITFPLRINLDSNNCGLIELSCENNRTVLHLNSNKYYVEKVSYSRAVCRIDPGLQKDNCSSLPRYSLTANQMFSSDDQQFGNYWYLMAGSEYGWSRPIISFVKCSVPMTSSLYTATTCFNTSITQDYLYVITEQNMQTSDLDTSCTLLMHVPALKFLSGTQEHNYSKIHDLLPMGFELSWEYSFDVVHVSWKDYLGWINPFARHNSMTYSFDSHAYTLGPLTRLGPWTGLGPWTDLNTCMDRSENILFHSSHFLPLQIPFAIQVLLPARTLIGVFCLAIFLAHKLRTRHIWMDATVEEFLSKHRYQTPTRYSYSRIKKMTKGFKEKIGQGGFGTVFRGKLQSGRLVAVKMLAKSKGNGQDFINEIATIGRIHHVNVVQLIGFCSEGSKRALIYDYMPNGSLEKYIFPQPESTNPLSWERTYQITLGIARGIEYLHRGCDMRILHFDIKPHNILLDGNYIPKVSDFGLAKFYPTEESIVSVTAVRGTLGYMAPELFYKNIGGVSYKSDVYSFGMLLMEMAGKRRNLNAMAENSSQIYFPLWIYDQIKQGNDMGFGNAEEDEKEIAKKLIIVALWCIQMKPIDRPSMSKVLEMLEGSMDLLQIPAKPFLSSPTRGTNEDDAGHMGSMGSLTTLSEYGLVSQDHTESNPLHVIVD
ncbi:uncharacterized protein LOC143856208 isoform X2 [Tasmannia lanceolata]|uniref:uncharacterized protein LOC143856208 isoform X2 n=1 Tax=Tasmannia lanceolata TaxID=3420 RepID=UPI00406294FD